MGAKKELEFNPEDKTNEKIGNKRENVIEVEARTKELGNSSRIEERNPENKEILF